MAVSELAVVNDALVRVGAETVPSFEDATAQALAVSTIYAHVRRRLLADHFWNFSLRSVIPPQLVLTSVQRRLLFGQYVYQMPADTLRVVGLESFSDFQLSADQLYTDDLLVAVSATNPNPPGVVYVADVAPSFWSPWFDELIVLELAAAFAIAITDQTGREAVYRSRADAYARRARALDSQQTPAIVYDLIRIYLENRGNPLAGN